MTDAAPAKPAFDKALVERSSFEKTAIWLPAFAVHHINAGHDVISGKTFTDCVIEGPAVLMATDDVVFDGCNMGATKDARNLLVQAVGPKLTGVNPFANTRFVRCRFLGVAFTGHPDFIKQIAETLKIASADA